MQLDQSDKAFSGQPLCALDRVFDHSLRSNGVGVWVSPNRANVWVSRFASIAREIMPTLSPFNWIGRERKPERMYHYVRWHWIRRSIANGSITLNDPLQCWNDPTERLWTNWIKQHIAPTVLAMCWTRTCRSEALWRLERWCDRSWPVTDQTVVRIRTSFDRLSRAVAGSTDLRDRLPGKCFLVPVKYLRDHEVERRFDGLAASKFVGSEAAQALSYKRYPYRYEREIRWVHVTNAPGNSGGRTPVTLETNTLIDQIMISPRANAAAAAMVEAEARDAGFINEVLHSRLFELPKRLRSFASRRDGGEVAIRVQRPTSRAVDCPGLERP